MPAKKKTSAPVAKQKPEAGELGLIRKLAEILNETGLTEIELDHKGARVRVAKTVQQTMMVGSSAPAQTAVHHAPAPTAGAALTTAPKAAEVSGTPLKSPMVGTAYLSAEPGAAPFVKAGDDVSQGQTLLVIEAMKVMNPIRAIKAGRVAQIFVKDASPVEFGELLIVIE